MNFDKLTEYIDSLNKEYGIPAADCKITMGHEVVYRHMTGYSDYNNRLPVTEDTLFRLFSATKVVTMTAVMQQIERGNLRLYDEVSDLLPEFDCMKVADAFKFEFPLRWPKSTDRCHYAHNTIRIIDLMSMTAGLSYDTTSKELIDIRERSNNQASTRDVIAKMAKMPLVYEPRTRYSYGLGHDVLAAVVEIVSGQKYSQYLKDNIFDPLGIKDFYFHWDDVKSLSDRICAMYMGVFGTDDIKPDDGIMSGSFKITANYESGGAGLAGTVDAYSTFIDALSNGGVGTNGVRILSEESVKLFTVPYTTGQMSEDFAFAGKIGYEYGLGVRVLVDDTVSKSPIGEFGWDGAAGAYALVDPFHHISIFYTQHIIGFPKVYHEIHPKIRDLAYECINNIN
jgi:CubicO group peptidase (beta-lactamase class C family)